MIHVIATIEVTAGNREKLVDQFKQLAPAVHAEDGCIEYGFAIDAATDIDAQIAQRPNVVTVVEKWESVAALQAHLIAPHMDDFRTRVGDYVTSISLQILDAV
jgi:quinol monooxygenase YgiN